MEPKNWDIEYINWEKYRYRNWAYFIDEPEKLTQEDIWKDYIQIMYEMTLILNKKREYLKLFF